MVSTVVHFSMSYDTKNIENGFTIGLIGSETDYQGMVYLDNVTLMSETKQEEDICGCYRRDNRTGYEALHTGRYSLTGRKQ